MPGSNGRRGKRCFFAGCLHRRALDVGPGVDQRVNGICLSELGSNMQSGAAYRCHESSHLLRDEEWAGKHKRAPAQLPSQAQSAEDSACIALTLASEVNRVIAAER